MAGRAHALQLAVRQLLSRQPLTKCMNQSLFDSSRCTLNSCLLGALHTSSSLLRDAMYLQTSQAPALKPRRRELFAGSPSKADEGVPQKHDFRRPSLPTQDSKHQHPPAQKPLPRQEIHAQFEERQLRRMQKVRQVLADRPRVDEQTLSQMISACNIERDEEALQACIALAKEQGIPLQASWYTCLLRFMYATYKQQRHKGFVGADSSKFKAVLADLQAAGLEPEHDALRFMAASHIHFNDTSRVEEYLDRMRQQLGHLSLAACEDLVSAYADLRLFQEAEALAQEAVDVHGATMSAQTCRDLWALVMHAYAAVGNVRQMERILTKIRALGVADTPIMYGVRIEAYRFYGQYAEARAVLEEAKAAGQAPNKFMYTSLLNAYGEAGQTQAAKGVIAEMHQARVQPTELTYSSLLRWLGQAGDVKGAWECFNSIEGRGHPHSQVTINCMTEALMQHWWSSGKPPQQLADAHSMYLRGNRNLLSRVAPGSAFYRGLRADLHHYDHWSAQLAVLSVFQELFRMYCKHDSFPESDLQFITGRGRSSRVSKAGVVRVSVLKFLQTFTSPKLAQRNEGLVVVRRREVLALLAVMCKSQLTFSPQAFAHHFTQ